ncbi:MAG: hypothetical protein OXB98_21855 [Bryobacterales bacterium]|nr:hypothetical protein [Bryobacterales bacterium]
MELIRGCDSQFAPEKTGQIRLCKATFYRDIDVANLGIRDEKEGETRLLAEGTITREAKDDLLLPETAVTIAMSDSEVVGTAHLKEGSKRATFKHELRTEVHPIPYIFCTSRRPESTDEERVLKEALHKEYNAWYIIKDADALGRELEKSINGWLFDRQVTESKLTKRYGWVKYYEGDKPRVIADMTDDNWGDRVTEYLVSMEAWFNKRHIYHNEAEYRYAFVIESSQLPTLPKFILLDLTMSAIRLFERAY